MATDLIPASFSIIPPATTAFWVVVLYFTLSMLCIDQCFVLFHYIITIATTGFKRFRAIQFGHEIAGQVGS